MYRVNESGALLIFFFSFFCTLWSFFTPFSFEIWDFSALFLRGLGFDFSNWDLFRAYPFFHCVSKNSESLKMLRIPFFSKGYTRLPHNARYVYQIRVPNFSSFKKKSPDPRVKPTTRCFFSAHTFILPSLRIAVCKLTESVFAPSSSGGRFSDAGLQKREKKKRGWITEGR